MVGDTGTSIQPIKATQLMTPASKASSKAYGQAMTEFAMIIPVLLVLLYGIIEGGRLLFIYTSVAAAGREAARYAAGIGQTGSTALYNDCAGIRAAATRIGFFAGVTASEVHIYHDSGPGTTQTEYCTSSTDLLASVSEGDRIDVKIATPYNPIVPILPIGPMTLKSESAHTILINVAVIAYTPNSWNVGQTCDNTGYVLSTGTPLGPTDSMTLTNPSSATQITNILVVWDGTGGPVLNSVTFNGSTIPNICQDGSTIGPYCSTNGTWGFASGSGTTLVLQFNKILKSPVIVRITFNQTVGSNVITCSFGQ